MHYESSDKTRFWKIWYSILKAQTHLEVSQRFFTFLIKKDEKQGDRIPPFSSRALPLHQNQNLYLCVTLFLVQKWDLSSALVGGESPFFTILSHTHTEDETTVRVCAVAVPCLGKPLMCDTHTHTHCSLMGFK